MKTVTLTPDEVKMIKEDIESSHQYFDEQLQGGYEPGCAWSLAEREETIKDANTAQSILKKIGDAP